MADSINPEDAEVIGQIRKFEEELFKTHNFKLYRNYHVPEYHVINSKRVLSFGIGVDAHLTVENIISKVLGKEPR
mgnify:CR=1 FL=1